MEIPKKITKKSTILAKFTCEYLSANAPGQVDMLDPPLEPPPPRRGDMLRDVVFSKETCYDGFARISERAPRSMMS